MTVKSLKFAVLLASAFWAVLRPGTGTNKSIFFVIHILFVCLGNICRSPLAQGVFEKKVNEWGWQEAVYADSAGVGSWHIGSTPHSGSRAVAQNHQVSIDHQRARQVSSSDNHEFHYFIAMDKENARSLKEEFGIDSSKVFLMRHFDPVDRGSSVPDPYGHGVDHFDEVFMILDRCMDEFGQFLRKNHPELP